MKNYLHFLRIKKPHHISLNYQIAQAGILLGLSFVISYLSLRISKTFIVAHGIDCSYFLMLVVLYLIGYRFALIVSILHGLGTIFISGVWIGGLANVIESLVLITTWLTISKILFKKDHDINDSKILAILKLLIAIIITALTCAVIMTLSNLYIFYPLLGAGNIIAQPAILWMHFIASGILNVVNIMLFLTLMPIIKKFDHNPHR